MWLAVSANLSEDSLYARDGVQHAIHNYILSRPRYTAASLRRVRLFNRRPNGAVLMIGGGGCGSFVRWIDVIGPLDACTATDRGCRPDRSVH